jgi:hypothetical protein
VIRGGGATARYHPPMVHAPSAAAAALFALFVVALSAACSGSAERASPGLAAAGGPPLQIPAFAASDPRVGKEGFVGETLRVRKEVDGTTFTLMAFAVGDTLTLGAMIKDTFRGTVHWTVGARELRVPFDAAAPVKCPVEVSGSDVRLVAEGAGFRGTSWTNIELPRTEWLPDGTPLQLEFLPEKGAAVAFPDRDVGYVAHYAQR